jgi:hypothetical protein
MKKFLSSLILSFATSTVATNTIIDSRLNILETDARKAMQGFNDLSKNLSIATISESIVSHDAQLLKGALQDVINLNKTVNSQVNVSIQFWNMYLDSVKIPTMESYLLGQVMNSLISTIRALSLRSSLDQAMILSFVKKYFSEDTMSPKTEVRNTVEIQETTVEDRWKSLKIE